MHRSRSVLVLFVVLITSAAAVIPARAATCGPTDHPGGEWRTYGQDLLNHRVQAEEHVIGKGNVASLSPKWIFNVEKAGGTGTIESTPIVADGCIFVTTQSGHIFALNADSGDLVWHAVLPNTVTSLAVAGGRVFADVSQQTRPYMQALDETTGELLWSTQLVEMQGSDTTGSPVAYDDVVVTGVSCIGAEGASGAARAACRGVFVILRQSDGEVLARAWGIPDEDFNAGYAGGGMWGVPAIDLATGYAYEGTGNPFTAREHARTNSVVKIDIDQNRPTFGTVVGSYKAVPELYAPGLGTYKATCEANANIATCEEPDLDVAQAPVIFDNARGQRIAAIGQGSGVTHAFRTDTMEGAWQSLTGVVYASQRGGGPAFDGKHIFQVVGAPGGVWALDPLTGEADWVRLTGVGTNTHNPIAVANGVVYSPGGTIRPNHLSGVPSMPFLNALDADTGDILLERPLATDIADVGQGTVAGGVVVARNIVYTPVNGVNGGGYIIAYRVPD